MDEVVVVVVVSLEVEEAVEGRGGLEAAALRGSPCRCDFCFCCATRSSFVSNSFNFLCFFFAKDKIGFFLAGVSVQSDLRVILTDVIDNGKLETRKNVDK